MPRPPSSTDPVVKPQHTRQIEQTNVFKRDLKREARGRHAKTLATDLKAILQALTDDQPLDAHLRDHALTGNWQGCRDCHVKPDLVLIYAKPDTRKLLLLRLGSHAELRI